MNKKQSMDKKQIVQNVIDLFSIPENWTSGCLARDQNMMPTADVHGNDTICWCAIGALKKYTPEKNFLQLVDEIAKFSNKYYLKGLANFNDTEGREKVLEMLIAYYSTLE